MKDQKVSFLRGENRGKPWAEDVRNPDGTQIEQEVKKKIEPSDNSIAPSPFSIVKPRNTS